MEILEELFTHLFFNEQARVETEKTEVADTSNNHGSSGDNEEEKEKKEDTAAPRRRGGSRRET